MSPGGCLPATRAWDAFLFVLGQPDLSLQPACRALQFALHAVNIFESVHPHWLPAWVLAQTSRETPGVCLHHRLQRSWRRQEGDDQVGRTVQRAGGWGVAGVQEGAIGELRRQIQNPGLSAAKHPAHPAWPMKIERGRHRTVTA